MLYFIVFAVIALRFIPHMPNLVPITAVAIFAAYYLKPRQAVAIPLIARFVSDLFIGFFSWPLMLAVYASHLAGVVVGLWIKKSQHNNSIKWVKIGISGFLTAGIFYLVTNLVVFYPEMYSLNFSSQITSYANALPFLRGTLLADVGYTVSLFGAYELALYLKRHWSAKSKLGLTTT